MSIIAIETRGRGFGSLYDRGGVARAVADSVAAARNATATNMPFTEEPPGSTSLFPSSSGSFIDQWGAPIGAAIGGLALGLLIVKFARRK